MSYNKIILIGNLTRDNELKYLQSGSAILNNSIATSHKYKKQDGTQMDEVMFLEFSLFAKSAEIFNQYTKKGSKVMLEGRLKLEQWQDQNGNKRSKHTLLVNEFKFLDSKQDNQRQSQNQQPQQNYNTPHQNQQQNNYQQPQQQMPQNNQQPIIDINSDEVPF